jgi:hypothetical protein
VKGDAREGACRADGQHGDPVDVQPEGAGCPVQVGAAGCFGGAGERQLVVNARGGAQLPPRGFEGAVGAVRPIERIEFGHIVG